MGVSTDAILVFGYQVEEEAELPWGENLDEWWMSTQGYVEPFKLYDESGNHINGESPTQERIKEYYEHQRLFMEVHPVPIEEVFHCSGDYPMSIIAVPDKRIMAHRGYPVEIRLDNPIFNVTDKERAALDRFVSDFGIPVTGNAAWWLCSNWS